jgi:hypothetical protein
MPKRLAFLAIASPLALLGFAAPAQAQDHGHAAVDQEIETYSEPVVQAIGEGKGEAGASYARDDRAEEADAGAGRDERHERHGRRPQRRGHATMAAGQPRLLAYSPAERAEWLSQCRALHGGYDEPVYLAPEEDADGGLIGGLLGAVAGGVIGNEVTDRHSLVGILIGAGIGGLAGAVIGSAIDSADDDERRVLAAPREPGFDYCEAYLINYERGYGTPQQVAYAPVTMVPVAQRQPLHGHGAYRVIVEESEIGEAPRHHRERRAIDRQSHDDKPSSGH